MKEFFDKYGRMVVTHAAAFVIGAAFAAIIISSTNGLPV